MTVASFDSLDEMFDHIERQNLRARSLFEDLPQWYRDSLRPGLCYATEASGILIFGELLERVPDPDDPEDVDDPRDGTALVRAFSPCCPEGEVGNTYLVNVRPITRERFDEARSRGWQVEADVVASWIEEALILLEEATRSARG